MGDEVRLVKGAAFQHWSSLSLPDRKDALINGRKKGRSPSSQVLLKPMMADGFTREKRKETRLKIEYDAQIDRPDNEGKPGANKG